MNRWNGIGRLSLPEGLVEGNFYQVSYGGISFHGFMRMIWKNGDYYIGEF